MLRAHCTLAYPSTSDPAKLHSVCDKVKGSILIECQLTNLCPSLLQLGCSGTRTKTWRQFKNVQPPSETHGIRGSILSQEEAIAEGGRDNSKKTGMDFSSCETMVSSSPELAKTVNSRKI